MRNMILKVSSDWSNNASILKLCGPIRFKTKKIRTVAICGGSGFDDIAKLKDQVDCFISGDCKYHQAQDATANKLALIDASHHLEVIMEQKVAAMIESFDIAVFQAGNSDYLQVK